jgi:restriction endonuclease S subunit
LLSSVAILRPRFALASTYLSRWLALESTRLYLKESFRSGSAIPRVVLKDLKRAHLLEPSRAVLTKFNEIVRPIFALARVNISSCDTMAAVRDGLLPKLLSGEIRVKEAEKPVGTCR